MTAIDERVASVAAAALSRWRRLGLAVLAGAIMTAGHPPIGVPWGLFIAVPTIFWLIRHAPGNWAAAWTGWAAGVGYFISGLHWIGHAFLVDPDRFAWLMPLGIIALPSAIALFWALAGWISFVLRQQNAVIGVLVTATVFTGAEIARSFVLTGFPWALPGYVWIDTPVVQAAAWIGPFALTFVTLALAGSAATLLDAPRNRTSAISVIAAIGVFGVLWLAGVERLKSAPESPTDAPVVRLVQPNAPQHLKWHQDHRQVFYGRLLEGTRAAPDPALGSPDVVIWPETAVAFLPSERPEERQRIADAAGGVPVLTGALHREPGPNGERWFNAFFSIMPDASIGLRYDKHHLVPFGEYVPFESLLGALGIRQFAVRGGFARGVGPATHSIPGLPAFSPLICYEAIFPHQVVGAPRPNWMIQVTNDAWFGGFAGPQQHLAQARIRAIEQGLPMVRAANTGISSIIDSYGNLIVSIDLGSYGHVDEKLPSSIAPTLYSRTGDMPFFVLIASIITFFVFRRIVAR